MPARKASSCRLPYTACSAATRRRRPRVHRRRAGPGGAGAGATPARAKQYKARSFLAANASKSSSGRHGPSGAWVRAGWGSPLPAQPALPPSQVDTPHRLPVPTSPHLSSLQTQNRCHHQPAAPPLRCHQTPQAARLLNERSPRSPTAAPRPGSPAVKPPLHVSALSVAGGRAGGLEGSAGPCCGVSPAWLEAELAAVAEVWAQCRSHAFSCAGSQLPCCTATWQDPPVPELPAAVRTTLSGEE